MSTESGQLQTPDVSEGAGPETPDDVWYRKLAAVERALEGDDSPELLSELPSKLWERINKVDPIARRLVLEEPWFSTMLPDEIHAFSLMGKLPSSGSRTTFAFSERDDARVVAEMIHPPIDRASPATTSWAATPQFTEAMERATRALQLRIDIADQLLRMRTFAKLDALAHRWPHLARALQVRGPDLNVLYEQELHAVRSQSLGALPQKLWAKYQDDDDLVRLLQLRPLFRDISPRDVARYFQVAETSLQQAAAPTAAVDPSAVTVAKLQYNNVIFTLQGQGTAYQVAIQFGEPPADPQVSAPITLDLDELKRVARATQSFRPATASPALVSRDVSAGPPERDQGSLLQRLGTETFERLFPDALAAKLKPLLSGNLRIAWKQDKEQEPALAALPWECLRVPPWGPSLGLDQQYSLIRYFDRGQHGPKPIFQPPFRVQVLMANPPDTPRLDVDTEERVLWETIGADPRVKLHILRGADATHDKLKERIRVFKPHIFHCIAHGAHDHRGRGVLILQDPDGNRGVHVASEHLASTLSSVQLAVLNACDTGRNTAGDAVASVAGALVGQGTPAVIATTRAVLDDRAILFAREFYRAFTNGSSLEAALFAARSVLNDRDWDWSVYALFTNTLDLDEFTLGPPPLRRNLRATAGPVRTS